MKLLIKVCLSIIITVFCFNGTADCNYEAGYINSKEQLSLFLNQMKKSVEDKQIFSQIIKTPIKLNFDNNLSKVFKTKKELLENHQVLMSSGLKPIFLNVQASDVFCNYEGGSIGAGALWFNANTPGGDIQIFSINATLKSPKEHDFFKYKVVEPLSGSGITTFLSFLKSPENKSVINDLNGMLDTSSEDSIHIKGDFVLYLADINNDGRKEYISIYQHSGSGKYSGIHKILSLKSGTLESLSLGELKTINNPSPHQAWLETQNPDWKEKLERIKPHILPNRIGSPFLFKKDGKIFFNFSENKINYSYLWGSDLLIPMGIYE